ATVEDARLRLIVASGSQGVGKSRLVAEFVAYLDGLATKVLWHEGHCASYGSVAFGAWAQIVRQRLGLAEDAPKDEVAAAVAASLPQWLPDPDERDFVATRLGVLLGTNDASLEQVDLFAGWRLFLERLAASHQVVIVVEDLQWADDGLLEFLEHVVDRTGRAPIFVVVIAQSEFAEQHPDWLLGRRAVIPFPVDPLADSTMRHLIDSLVPDLPATAVDRIVSYAQGVPLYAIESIRTLIDRGTIEARDGRLRLVQDLVELDTPASLTGLVAARLDALPGAERDLLLGLSVLGTSFPRAAVAPSPSIHRPTSTGRSARWYARTFSRCATSRCRPNAASTPSPRTCSAPSPTTWSPAVNAPIGIRRWPTTCDRRSPTTARTSSTSSPPTTPTPAPALPPLREPTTDSFGRRRWRATSAPDTARARWARRTRPKLTSTAPQICQPASRTPPA
ncbi:MAG: ATP-binding protein, partial [Geodermatophilaceae bacterium]